MEVSAGDWALTIGVIVVLLGLDLLLATVRPHAVGSKEAAAWSMAYIAVVLVFGVIAALVLRAVFIAVGAALLSALSFMFLVLGLLLVWTAVRLYRYRDEDPDISSNALVRRDHAARAHAGAVLGAPPRSASDQYRPSGR